MINRYKTFFGYTLESNSLAFNMNENIIKLINIELFSSPINNLTNKFCWLFYNIEKYFGWIGSAFCFNFDKLQSGNIVYMNPPFDEDYYDKCIEIIKKFPENIYIVIHPYWTNCKNYNYLMKHNNYKKVIYLDWFIDYWKNNNIIKKNTNIKLMIFIVDLANNKNGVEKLIKILKIKFWEIWCKNYKRFNKYWFFLWF